MAQVGDHEARLYALPLVRGGRRRGDRRHRRVPRADTTARPTSRSSAPVGARAAAAGRGGRRDVADHRSRAATRSREMTRSAAEWSEHEPGRRFGAEPRPDELGELARTFDALLDRVSAAACATSSGCRPSSRTSCARRSRASSGEIELLQRRERSPEERGGAHDAIARSAEQMLRILEVLMAAARAEAAPAGAGRSRLGRGAGRGRRRAPSGRSAAAACGSRSRPGPRT